ncbi:MerR family transcriptional regulator [Ferdinandcohnia sp. Marseille-Q9671]
MLVGAEQGACTFEFRRWCFDGIGKYRIGELAEMANVTKRTIDYYTNLGIIKAERTASNYRYYSQESLEILRFVEDCKQKNLSLEEIRELLTKNEQNKKSDPSQEALQTEEKIITIKENVEDLLPLLEKLDEDEKRLLLKRLSPEHVTVIHSLLMLLA